MPVIAQLQAMQIGPVSEFELICRVHDGGHRLLHRRPQFHEKALKRGPNRYGLLRNVAVQRNLPALGKVAFWSEQEGTSRHFVLRLCLKPFQAQSPIISFIESRRHKNNEWALAAFFSQLSN